MPLLRRQFMAACGAASLATSTPFQLAGSEPRRSLCVISYNVFACTGWPANRARARQAVATGDMPQRFATELARYEPDIISFSESPSEEVVKKIAALLDMRYTRFCGRGDWPGTILSRFEIVESADVPLAFGERPRSLFTRHWGRATIKVPNGEPLIVHSAHLYPNADATIRLREIAAMLTAMKPDLDRGRSMLLLGDLNHGPDSKEYDRWRDAGWIDTFRKVGRGNGSTFRSDIPQWRVDFVMAAGPIASQVVTSRPLLEGAFRLNIADPQSFALSDHLPQLAVFNAS